MKTKKNFLYLFVLLINFSFAQQFKEAYYVNNLNEKIDGFVKVNALHNDKFVKFKANLKADEEILLLEDFKELVIERKSFYYSAKVTIDTNRKENVDPDSYPELKVDLQQEFLLLEKLVEGKKNLFVSYKKDIPYYFISDNYTNFNYLIYNIYNDGLTSRENTTFRQQLTIELNPDFEMAKKINSLRYFKFDLSKLFNEYNSLSGNNKLFVSLDDDKMKIKLNVIAGVKQLNFDILVGQTRNFKFDKTVPVFGLEADFQFKKFSLFVRNTITSKYNYTSNKTVLYENSISYNEEFVSEGLLYSLNFGVRKNIFKNIFIDASLEFQKNLKNNTSISFTNLSSTSLEGWIYEYNIIPTANVGLGYILNNKIAFDVRYYFNRNPYFETDKGYIIAKNSNINFNLIYTLF